MPSELRLKGPEPSFQFPLRGGLFAAVEKRLALGGRLVRAEHLRLASSDGSGKRVRRGPQTRARQKVVLHPRASQLLQILVAQVVVECCTDVFAGNLNAAYALIIRRERHRHMSRAVE